MTKIEWTGETWNPITGCTPIATGCKRCYAKEMHRRLRAMGQEKYQHDFSDVRCHPEEFGKMLRWRKQRMVFVCSMSDLFHESVPNSFIMDVFDYAQQAGTQHGHTFQFLTKRPARMLNSVRRWQNGGVCGAGPFCSTVHTDHPHDMPPFFWFGASASTQADLDRACHHLLKTPAAVRFLSLEPLIEDIDLEQVFSLIDRNGEPFAPRCDANGNSTVSWVIVGGESGPHRRECETEWVHSIVDQCKEARVACFVKQIHINGKVSKDMTEWPEDLRVREMPPR